MSSKKAIVTGASSGFGFETAKILANNGWQVLAIARRVNKLKELQNQNPTISILELDITDTSLCKDKIDEYLKTNGTPDLLVNNAGGAIGTNKAYECELSDWHNMINVNITALINLTHQILPGMVKNNRGLIINIGSIAGSWPYPGGNVYGATKAFVHQFSRNLKCDLLGTNVRVTSLEPGLAETEFSVNRFKGDKSKAESVYDGTKPISAVDIANTIFWIANTPEHININSLEIMATCQAWAPYSVYRN
jgi:3-hydroxy acid dehydrogenase/malonic semialdehyde reductase